MTGRSPSVPPSIITVPLGEVRYLGSGTDSAGQPSWHYACVACNQTWYLPDLLPQTRGHHCLVASAPARTLPDSKEEET